MLSDFPFSFLGLTATKPMEISRSTQTLKMSIDFANAINTFGVLSGRNAPRFVATGFSRSMVAWWFQIQNHDEEKRTEYRDEECVRNNSSHGYAELCICPADHVVGEQHYLPRYSVRFSSS